MRWKQINFYLILTLCFLQYICAQDDVNDDKKEESVDEAELIYESPQVDLTKFYFIDHFDDADKEPKKWVRSNAKKDDTAEEISKYDGVWSFESPERIVWKNDLGLVLKSKAKHAAISSKLIKKFKFDDKPLVVQYEVTMQNIQDCGGSYIKLLSDGPSTLDLTQFNDKTPYTVMFGPDKCGNDIKLHFIFRHVNPINGSITEKHCKKPKERLEEPFKDKLPHLYQLIVNPDNTFQISVDHKIINEGSLLNDFQPAVNPLREIDDPSDKKPENWDEREKIPDPDAVKPDNWDEDAPALISDPSAVIPTGWLEDEPEMIADPSAKKPEDWDAEIDGEWEAPLIDNPICEKASGCGEWKAPQIDNPNYQGKWRAPLIDNPNYQGKWSPRKIPNPDFFEDLNPFHMTPISAVGIEIWSMSDDILFDNIIITDDVEVAKEYAEKTFDLKRRYINKESESVFSKLVQYTIENPWIWGVYIVVFGTILSFVIYSLCCAKQEKTSKIDVGEQKKTDEPSPDDEDGVDNDDEPIAKSNMPKKSDLDVKVPDSHSDEEEVEIIDNNEVKSNEDLDQPKTEDIQPHSDGGTRKRKPRKE